MDYVKGDSIFTSINKVPVQYEYLTEDITTDVAIIGGGVTGAIVSYYFSEAGIDNVVLEANRIGHKSTSVTTSLLQYELDGNIKELHQYLCEEKAIRSYKLSCEALAEVEKLSRTLDNDFDYIKVDSVLYSLSKLDYKSILEEYDTRKKYGFDVTYQRDEEKICGLDFRCALISKSGGAKIDPYKFTHALLKSSVEKGAKIFENTEVKKIIYTSDGVEIITEFNHKIKANKVIIATGYDKSIGTKSDFGENLTTTFNIATSPIDNLDAIYDKYVFRDNEAVYHYFRTTKDKRIIMGGEDVNFPQDMDNCILCEKQYDALEKLTRSLFNMYDFKIDYKYCGAFANTPDNLGFIGSDPQRENQWFCLGYGANGILFAMTGAKILLDIYNGNENKDAELFRVDRFRKK